MTAGCLLKSGYDDIMEKALLYSTTVSLSRQRLRIKGVVNLSAWNQHGKYMCSIRYFCIGEEEEEVAGWICCWQAASWEPGKLHQLRLSCI